MIRAGRFRLRFEQATADRIAKQEAFRLVGDTTRRIFNRANILTPVDTGTLRAGNQMAVSRASRGAHGWVYNNIIYADTVHDGSAPYTIRPKKGKALKFVVDGQTVFARSVRHPGTKGRPWIARAGREIATRQGFTWTSG